MDCLKHESNKISVAEMFKGFYSLQQAVDAAKSKRSSTSDRAGTYDSLLTRIGD